jgi:hypothetical protein
MMPRLFELQLGAWALIILIFFILREFWTWYWKINQMVDLLRSIDLSLQSLPTVQQMRRRAP